MTNLDYQKMRINSDPNHILTGDNMSFGDYMELRSLTEDAIAARDRLLNASYEEQITFPTPAEFWFIKSCLQGRLYLKV